jgi:hypothetical protein
MEHSARLNILFTELCIIMLLLLIVVLLVGGCFDKDIVVHSMLTHIHIEISVLGIELWCLQLEHT